MGALIVDFVLDKSHLLMSILVFVVVPITYLVYNYIHKKDIDSDFLPNQMINWAYLQRVKRKDVSK